MRSAQTSTGLDVDRLLLQRLARPCQSLCKSITCLTNDVQRILHDRDSSKLRHDEVG
jgi:hypothetical protein